MSVRGSDSQGNASAWMAIGLLAGLGIYCGVSAQMQKIKNQPALGVKDQVINACAVQTLSVIGKQGLYRTGGIGPGMGLFVSSITAMSFVQAARKVNGNPKSSWDHLLVGLSLVNQSLSWPNEVPPIDTIGDIPKEIVSNLFHTAMITFGIHLIFSKSPNQTGKT